MPKEIDKEQLVASILVELNFSREWTQSKKLAVERYMRTYLRGLTLFELEMMDKMLYDNVRNLHPDVEFYVNKASRGYDAFMAKRGKVRV